MTVLFIILPLTVLVASLAVVAFVWSAKSGQLDDLGTPPLRVLENDDAQVTNREPDVGDSSP